MPPRRKIDPIAGRTALDAWRNGDESRPTLTMAVRFLLEELAQVAPGNAVEVRVPPAGAVQCVDGPRHTRGTPPNTVEMNPHTWLELATGIVTWEKARHDGRVRASGVRADLSPFLSLHAARSRTPLPESREGD